MDSSAKALSLLINTEIKSSRADDDEKRIQSFQEEQSFTHSSPKMWQKVETKSYNPARDWSPSVHSSFSSAVLQI